MQTENLFKIFEENGFLAPRTLSFSLEELPQIDFYPVSMKIDSPKVVHKSDVGGVILNICNEIELKNARSTIIDNLKKANILLDKKDHFIATEMIHGEELYIGAIEDDIFGKTILFGKGGVLLELYQDICYIDINADEEEIRNALKQTRIIKLFEGFRKSKHTLDEAVLFIQKFQKFLKLYPTISELDLNPIMLTPNGFVIIDARVKFAEEKPVKKTTPLSDIRPNFFNNKSVALIGASHDPEKVGYALAENLLDFQGECYFVNLKGGMLFGKECYTDSSKLVHVDTAVIATPPATVYAEIEKLIPKGLRNVIIITAGFKEIGNYQEETRILNLAQTHKLNILGPNCLGYTHATTKLNATFAADAPLDGNIALLSQSGAVLTALMDKADDLGIGFSHIISFGNMSDLDFDDAIEQLQHETSCQYICMYIEGIKDGKSLLKTVRDSSKPIIFYKSGRTRQSQKAAFSHTGNLSGNYKMSIGLLRAAGAHLASSIEALIYTSSFTRAENILILTNAGGPGTILADLIDEKEKTFYTLSDQDINLLNAVLPSNWSHHNPIDLVGDATAKRYEAALNVIKDFDVGLIFAIISPQSMTDDEAIAKVLQNSFIPVIPIWLGGDRLQKGKTYCEEHDLLSFDSLIEAANILVN